MPLAKASDSRPTSATDSPSNTRPESSSSAMIATRFVDASGAHALARRRETLQRIDQRRCDAPAAFRSARERDARIAGDGIAVRAGAPACAYTSAPTLAALDASL